jgi:hypothetical protein
MPKRTMTTDPTGEMDIGKILPQVNVTLWLWML